MEDQKKKSIEIKCSGSDNLPIDVILDFQGKLKKLSKENLNRLKNNIILNGFIAPIFVFDDKGDYRILDGHQRLSALLSLREDGYDLPLIPVAFIHAENETEAKKMLLSISSQFGEFELEELKEWISELEDGIAETLRLVNEEIKIDIDTEENETEGDDEISEDVQPITKLGDIWELGNHRVLCGDSTDSDHVARLMNGQKADMVFTDPPYGVEYTGGLKNGKNGLESNNREMIKNDKTDDIFTKVIPIISQICVGPVYTWFAGTKATKLYQAIESVGKIHSLIIWEKSGGYGALNANYKQKHEPCLYWKAKGRKLNFCGASTETTIWKIDKDGLNKLHPTQKPVRLAEKAINNHSVGLITDLFLGSGSTLIAAEKTNRICFGMELDEHYCDVIVKRYVQWCEKNEREIDVKLNGKQFDHSVFG